MASKEDFERSWNARYPDQTPPNLTCFNQELIKEKQSDLPGNQTIPAEVIEDEIQKHQCIISDLQYKMEKEEFIIGYLWDLLHGSTWSNSNTSEVLFQGSQATTETAEAESRRTQMPTESGAKIEPDQYMNMPDANDLNIHTNVSSQSRILNVVSSHGEISQSFSRPQLLGHLNDKSKSNTSTNTSHTNANQTNEASHITTVTSNIGEFNTPGTTTKILLTTKGASFSGTVKPSVKPRSFRGASVSETAKGKHKPPVPAPRPSTKGPTYKSRVSFAVDSPVSSADSVHSQDWTTSPAGLNKGTMTKTVTKGNQDNCTLAGYSTNQEGLSTNKAATATANIAIVSKPDRPPLIKQTVLEDNAAREKQRSSIRHIVLQTDFGETSTDIKENPITEPISTSTPARPPRRPSDLSQLNQSMSSIGEQSDGSRRGSGVEETTVPEGDEQEEGEVSSDEDTQEPIYFNIQASIQKSMSLDNAKLYKSSAQREQRALERAARRLTQRITMKELGQLYRPEVPEESEEDSHDTSSIDDNLEELPAEGRGSEVSYSSKDLTGQTETLPDAEAGGQGKKETKDERWKKRKSMLMAMGDNEETDSISSMEEMQVNMSSRSMYKESDQLQMRKWVVTSILASEQEYTRVLNVMHQYMNSFKAAAKTCQPLISEEDTKKIFFLIPELLKVHSDFVKELEPLVENWEDSRQIGLAVKTMLSLQLPIAEQYLKHYHKSVACIQKCSGENQTFQALAQEIRFPGMTEKLSLEELLHKPVVRVQRNTLVLHDLIKCTPVSHPDYDMLQNALSMAQHFLENFENPGNNKTSESYRHIVKNSFIVEKVGSHRKLRHVFLFNDVIACAKQKIGARDKIQFECKWFIRLENLKVDTKVSASEEKKLLETKKDVDDLQRRVSALKKELKTEVRKSRISDRDRNWSFRGTGRNIDKIKKRLAEQETELLLASPSLVFRLQNKNKKHYTFLMTSDYERNDWSEHIKALKAKIPEGYTGQPVTVVELQNLMNDENQQPKMNDLGSYLMKEDDDMEDEHLTGSLLVTIHSLDGLDTPCDTYCTIEVDSFSHFFMKARTSPIWKSKNPCWNEDFDIELDGAQTLRILAYKKEPSQDVLLGRCALELSRAWLRGDFQEKAIALNEDVSVMVSLRYTTRAQTLKRHPSSVGTGLFGVHLAKVTQREGTRIPNIVTACVEEVRRRGLEEVGVYRVSGLNGEIQKIKKAFERNTKGALPHIREADIHVVTGVIKLYFRELPQPLFTEDLYRSFVEGIRLSDPESKRQCLISLMRKLPEPNHTTTMYMLDHLVEVATKSGENKMSITNLATVFGPTLLRPGSSDEEQGTMESFMAGARDAMMQSAVLMYVLNLRKDGETFAKEPYREKLIV